MEAGDRQPPLGRVGDGVVGREAPVGAGRRWVLGEEPLDGVGTGAVAAARPADRRQLVDVERRVLALGVEDRLPHLGGMPPVLVDLRRRDEARHPELLEARHLAIDGARGRAGLGGPLGRRLPEEDDRADQFVGPLPRRPRQGLDLVPVVGRLDPWPWQHPPHPLPLPVFSLAGGAL